MYLSCTETKFVYEVGAYIYSMVKSIPETNST